NGSSTHDAYDCFIAHPHVTFTSIVVHRIDGFFAIPAHVGPGDPVMRLGFTFVLGPESNGIDPLTEPVALGIGGVALAIPPGSFRREHNGGFHFRGRIEGVEPAMEITPRASRAGAPVYEGSREAPN